MRPWIIVALLVVLITVLFSILFFVSKVSEETKKEIINPDKYDEIQGGLLGKGSCSDDSGCQVKFNENWACGNQLKCWCPISDIYSPVCGSNKQTYFNLDEIGCSGVKFAYNGECVIEDNGGDKFCRRCGDGCVTFDPSIPSVCPADTAYIDINFECKIINGKCTKISSDGFCGDGICETTESCSSCSQDCGFCDIPVCGNGICEDNEVPFPTAAPDLTYCPQDCNGGNTQITNLPLTVISPNGGENWQIGSNQEIKWTIESSSQLGNVDILLTMKNEAEGIGVTLGGLIAQNTENDGLYEWRIALDNRDQEFPVGEYILTIRGLNSEDVLNQIIAIDSSNDFFTISS